MAKFLRHTACPNCGSRDNLGEYDDGSAYCFGCSFSRKRSVSGFVSEREEADTYGENRVPTVCGTTDIPDWLFNSIDRMGITLEELLLHGYRWNPESQQLILPLKDLSGNLVATQARNYSESRRKKQKYFNQGDTSLAFPLYGSFGTKLVVTEDALSAIKIARQCDAMPALGTSLPYSKIIALSPRYQTVRVWLDSDKFREAQHIADNFKWLGLSAKAIYSELDPKYYSNDEIKEYIK